MEDKSATMSREDLESWLSTTVLELQDGLAGDQVIASASLVYDLGFDSLALEGLAAAIESAPSVDDLAPWYSQALSDGDDSVRGLVDFLVAAGARACNP